MTEKEIIEGCIKKDSGSERLLFDQYAGLLMTICRRYGNTIAESEDMLQESFIRIFKAIKTYRFLGSFEGWIKRITVNCCLKMLQKNGISFVELPQDNDYLPSISPYELPEIGKEDLLQLICSLPEGYRIVFNLYALEGYSHEEIGKLLNIKTASSRSQLAKARKHLQQQLQLPEKMNYRL